MTRKSRLLRAREAELKNRRETISSIQSDLEQAYACFNSETDPSLTEAHIYEISALRARYNHAFLDIKSNYQ